MYTRKVEKKEQGPEADETAVAHQGAPKRSLTASLTRWGAVQQSRYVLVSVAAADEAVYHFFKRYFPVGARKGWREIERLIERQKDRSRKQQHCALGPSPLPLTT